MESLIYILVEGLLYLFFSFIIYICRPLIKYYVLVISYLTIYILDQRHQ